ncbi:MAG: hypothetical protein KDC42_01865 [Ignavibacteriae bacterium]|nr:hypothetical protein [Ignavibacteriota bacterium]
MSDSLYYCTSYFRCISSPGTASPDSNPFIILILILQVFLSGKYNH